MALLWLKHRCPRGSLLIYTIGQAAIRPTQVQTEGECQVSRGSCGKENIITAICGKCDLSQPFTMVPELLHKSKSSDEDKCVLRRKTELRPEAVWLSQCHGQVAFFLCPSFLSFWIYNRTLPFHFAHSQSTTTIILAWPIRIFIPFFFLVTVIGSGIVTWPKLGLSELVLAP